MPDENPTTLLEALLEVQKAIPELKLSKDALGQVAGNRKYRYMTLHKLHAEVLPLLSKHHLIWVTFPMRGEDGPELSYELRAMDGDSMMGRMPLMLDKNNSQGLGSAITYARRYALCAVLGIVADEDDDGAKASVAEVRGTVQKWGSKTGQIGDEPTQEMMTSAQIQNMLRAVNDAPLTDKSKELILAAAGVDSSTKDVTIQQGREIRRRLEAAQNGTD